MQRIQVRTDRAPGAVGPYSQALVVDRMVFVSGQLPIDAETGRIVDYGIRLQAKRAFENLRLVLEAAGTDMDHVVKTTVFLKDMNDFAVMNEVYGEFFQPPYPARSCIQVARIPKDVLVEIEAIALLD